MQQSAELAGKLAAHSMWSVADAEPVIPLFARGDGSDRTPIERLVTDDPAAAVELAKQNFDQPGEWPVLVLVYDTVITLESGVRTDALLVEFAQRTEPVGRFTMAVPYRPAPEFAIYRPKLIQASTLESTAVQAVVTAFYNGVDSHNPAGQIWNEHLQDVSL
ncbi:hypothetical protein [Kribbella solani]|uniref:Uncharacterized protein n=1 Tax=Kribbella solani TaxID=236067 RepID=A0A841DQ27_9ACTN|nr:hypothetical protein [Kribbella solani]MBB5980001.1 hypothetical protein [Kribbella solani]MDX2972237.1 hypothetical protein [Kribbella solani]MDX3005623.1 hypothetical protein [Kribbella solani]